MTRLSVIGFLDINAVIFSSVVFIGDNWLIAPRTRVIAVRRDFPSFFGNEGRFEDYPLFQRDWPRLPVPADVHFVKRDEGVIQVDLVRLTSLSTSAMFQAGSTHTVRSESRVKQFRQLASTNPAAFSHPPAPR